MGQAKRKKERAENNRVRPVRLAYNWFVFLAIFVIAPIYVLCFYFKKRPYYDVYWISLLSSPFWIHIFVMRGVLKSGKFKEIFITGSASLLTMTHATNQEGAL